MTDVVVVSTVVVSVVVTVVDSEVSAEVSVSVVSETVLSDSERPRIASQSICFALGLSRAVEKSIA